MTMHSGMHEMKCKHLAFDKQGLPSIRDASSFASSLLPCGPSGTLLVEQAGKRAEHTHGEAHQSIAQHVVAFFGPT